MPLEVVGGEVQVPHVGIPQLGEVPVCGDCVLAADLKIRQSTFLTCANAAVDECIEIRVGVQSGMSGRQAASRVMTVAATVDG